MNQDNLNGKDLITSEEVYDVVNGNQQALIEQLERAKQVALMQLQASVNNKQNQVSEKSRQQLEEEYRKKEAALNAALASAQTKLAPSDIIEKQKALEKQQAEQEMKRLQVEKDIQQRSKMDLSKNKSYNSSIDQQQVPTKLSKKELKKQKKEALKLKKQEEKKALQLKKQQEQQALQLQQQQQQEQKALQSKQQQQQINKEKVKSENTKNEKKESNFKYVMTIILFIFLFSLVYFLPYISNYIAKIKAQKANDLASIITTGNLECKMSKYSEKYDYIYENVFSFKNNKLLKLRSTITTKGDKTLDEEDLNNMKDQCELLKSETKDLEGVVINCRLNNGVNINEQILNYENINVEKLNTSYLEAGGIYPNYKYLDDMDKIEKEMNASGYTCSRLE